MDWMKVYRNLAGSWAAAKGDSGWPPLILVRALLPAIWHDLSDAWLVEALPDQASFRQFYGFAGHELKAERTAFVRSRGYLVRRSLGLALFGAGRGMRDINFDQDTLNCSRQGGQAGPLYRIPLSAQRTLMRLEKLTVFDVEVYISQYFKVFFCWEGVEPSEANRPLPWFPPGAAHCFLILSNEQDAFFKTNDYYSPAHERYIWWGGSTLTIASPLGVAVPNFSAKDAWSEWFHKAKVWA
jgi:dTDP-4-dehydrorhamnose 3,5-epimerase-like enzyme